MKRRVLVARQDNAGDVLLSGPAVRAIRAHAEEVIYLCGDRGAEAALLLPSVDQVIVRTAEWIDPNPSSITRFEIDEFVSMLENLQIDEAAILTSFHQSPLPLALLLKMAGVGRVAAVSADYPGALLDVRCQVNDDVHEVVRALAVAFGLGYELPAGDEGLLSIKWTSPPGPELNVPDEPYVVLHPGASVPARAWNPELMRGLQRELARRGYRVVVTGSKHEASLTQFVAEDETDLGGKTDLATLAGVIERSLAIVTGNTGPSHLAAAVNTPVVSLYAPTVPASRWHPWRVMHRTLGDQSIACSGCRARICTVPGHPCIDDVTIADVLRALEELASLPVQR